MKQNMTVKIRNYFAAILLCVAFFIAAHTFLNVKPDPLVCLKTQNIFFVETSGARHLNFRQACAVESAARIHPAHDVIVLMTSSHLLDFNHTLMRKLGTLNNTRILRGNVYDVLKETPLFTLHREGKWNKSPYKVYHVSDAVRLALLWRFGGIYLDMDTVSLKFLGDLKNATVDEYNDTNGVNVGNAVLFFTKGHPLLWDCMCDFASNYAHNEFARNGPLLLTRAIKNRCQISNLKELNNCDVTVLPRYVAFPISYDRWMDYFKANVSLDVSSSYLIHVWNKMSKDAHAQLVIGDGSLYEVAMRDYCPDTYEYVSSVAKGYNNTVLLDF